MSEHETFRKGIVTVSTDLLGEWMHLPVGTRIVDVRSRDGGINGQFEILIEGAAVPETNYLWETPHLTCLTTVTRPKVEFLLRDKKVEAG